MFAPNVQVKGWIGNVLAAFLSEPRHTDLQLPSSMKIHPIFHVSLLDSYQESDIPNHTQAPLPPVIIDEEIEYEIESILESKIMAANGCHRCSAVIPYNKLSVIAQEIPYILFEFLMESKNRLKGSLAKGFDVK